MSRQPPSLKYASPELLFGKVFGVINLAEAIARLGLEMDFLALFSSASAVLGFAGEAGYAAANSCLDGVAQ